MALDREMVMLREYEELSYQEIAVGPRHSREYRPVASVSRAAVASGIAYRIGHRERAPTACIGRGAPMNSTVHPVAPEEIMALARWRIERRRTAGRHYAFGTVRGMRCHPGSVSGHFQGAGAMDGAGSAAVAGPRHGSQDLPTSLLRQATEVHVLSRRWVAAVGFGPWGRAEPWLERCWSLP